MVPFTLESGDSYVVSSKGVIKLSDWLADSKCQPHAEPVKYHTKKPEPIAGKPDHFTLERNVTCAYQLADVPTDDGSAVLSTLLGSTIPWNTWNTGSTTLLWSLRSSQKGCVPVRPSVHVMRALTIPANAFLRLD